MKAIFLDKDGTLLNDVPYNIDPQRMVLTNDAGAGLRLFVQQGYQLIVVSNQAGIARGFFGEDAMHVVKLRLAQLLKIERVDLHAFYYCPHHPEGLVAGYRMDCTCRKPAAGMLMQAAAEHDIELEDSWMIGDILDDIEAGKRAGCRTILIDNGNETEWLISTQRKPDFMAPDLLAAARLVAHQEEKHDRVLAKSGAQ